jgi:glutathione S-transferase
VGAPWKDKLYFERSEWFSKDKEQLNLNFPNLPYLIDGNLRLT